MQQPIINSSASKLRIILILSCSFVVTLYYSIKTVLVGLFISRKDKARSRKNIDNVIEAWGKKIVRLTKIDWQLIGDLESQIPPNRPVILMCNHASAYDIPLAFVAVPGSIRMIAKKELYKIPFLSRALKTAEFPSIDRQNREQAIKDLAYAKEKMESGIRLWMFPEGTRSSDGQLQNLKKGGIRLAIDTDAIIVPLVMQDIEHILPNMKWLKMRLKQPVQVRVGKVVDCQNYDVEQRHEVSEMVYNQMKSLLETRD